MPRLVPEGFLIRDRIKGAQGTLWGGRSRLDLGNWATEVHRCYLKPKVWIRILRKSNRNNQNFTPVGRRRDGALQPGCWEAEPHSAWPLAQQQKVFHVRSTSKSPIWRTGLILELLRSNKVTWLFSFLNPKSRRRMGDPLYTMGGASTVLSLVSKSS